MNGWGHSIKFYKMNIKNTVSSDFAPIGAMPLMISPIERDFLQFSPAIMKPDDSIFRFVNLRKNAPKYFGFFFFFLIFRFVVVFTLVFNNNNNNNINNTICVVSCRENGIKFG